MFDGFVASYWTLSFLSYFYAPLPPNWNLRRLVFVLSVCVCVCGKTLTMAILLKRKRYKCHIWHT